MIDIPAGRIKLSKNLREAEPPVKSALNNENRQIIPDFSQKGDYYGC
jgi:hypothetical protein